MCANTTLYHFNLKVEAQGKQIAFLGSLSFKEVVFHQLCGRPMLGKLIPQGAWLAYGPSLLLCCFCSPISASASCSGS